MMKKTAVVSPPRSRPLSGALGGRLGALPALLLFGATSCSLFQPSGPPRQKGEVKFSSCITGSAVEKAQNCAEYCAGQNLACQNFGCGHTENPSTRFGGASYENGLCSGNAVRNYQCNDPFLQDGAVRCCCTGL